MKTMTITQADAIRGEKWYRNVYQNIPFNQRGIEPTSTYTCHCVVANAARRVFRKYSQRVAGSGRITVKERNGRERVYTSTDPLVVGLIQAFDDWVTSVEGTGMYEKRREKVMKLLPLTVNLEKVR